MQKEKKYKDKKIIMTREDTEHHEGGGGVVDEGETQIGKEDQMEKWEENGCGGNKAT